MEEHDDTDDSTDTAGVDGRRETGGTTRTAVGVRCLKSEVGCSTSLHTLLVGSDSGEVQ